MITYNDLLNRLRAVSPDEYEWEARILVEHFCGISASSQKSRGELNIDSDEIEQAILRREAHEPLQYIIGEWDFYRQTYYVDENCLIPRSDTEILVELATELLPKNAYFADLCTGSGCICISTLCERSDTNAIMVDKFPKTLDVAKRNAARNGVADRVVPMLFDVLSDGDKLLGKEFDAILSNPPYIRPEVIAELSPEVKREPYAALYGGDDGLIFYRKLVGDYSKFLKNEGFFLFEIGYDQAAAIRSIAEEHGFKCRIHRDLGGNDRVAHLYKSNNK